MTHEWILIWLLVLTSWQGFWAVFDYRGSKKAFDQLDTLDGKAHIAIIRSDYGNKKASEAVELVHKASDNGKKRYYEVVDRLNSLEKYLKIQYEPQAEHSNVYPRHIKITRRKK